MMDYQDQQEVVHRREASTTNEVWQADHTVLDILVLDDGAGARRPWSSVVLDDRSLARKAVKHDIRTWRRGEFLNQDGLIRIWNLIAGCDIVNECPDCRPQAARGRENEVDRNVFRVPLRQHTY